MQQESNMTHFLENGDWALTKLSVKIPQRRWYWADAATTISTSRERVRPLHWPHFWNVDSGPTWTGTDCTSTYVTAAVTNPIKMPSIPSITLQSQRTRARAAGEARTRLRNFKHSKFCSSSLARCHRSCPMSEGERCRLVVLMSVLITNWAPIQACTS